MDVLAFAELWCEDVDEKLKVLGSLRKVLAQVANDVIELSSNKIE